MTDNKLAEISKSPPTADSLAPPIRGRTIQDQVDAGQADDVFANGFLLPIPRAGRDLERCEGTSTANDR